MREILTRYSQKITAATAVAVGFREPNQWLARDEKKYRVDVFCAILEG